MGSTARILASLGYNDSPASRAEREGTWPSAPTSPVSAKRLRRGRSREYFRGECFRVTPDERRVAMRKEIKLYNERLADPANDWDRDGNEYGRRHYLLRYQRAISEMAALPALPLPAEYDHETRRAA